MKKLIYILLVLVVLVMISSCEDRAVEAEKSTTEPLVLLHYEKDDYGDPVHKILYNTNTKLYYEYIYYYQYDGCYRNVTRMDTYIYDQSGAIIKSLVEE